MFKKSLCLFEVVICLLLPLTGCKKKNEDNQNSQEKPSTILRDEIIDTGIILPTNRFDSEGFDSFGFDSEGFNRKGFNLEGFNRLGFDRYGFNREGFTRHGFNRLGFNRQGFDREGFNRFGFNAAGFDRHGFDREGFNRYGFNRENVHRTGVARGRFDHNGFNWEGFDREGYNREGFDRHGFNRDRLCAQYPRKHWVRRQEGEQTLWGFQEFDFFAELAESQVDRIIQEKRDQLNLTENQNPVQFITIINQMNNRLTERLLDRIAELILDFQDSWNRMNPNLEQVIQLASSIPGSSAIQNAAIWGIKRNALERGIVQNVDDFQHLLGVIPPDLVQGLYFVEARTNWFIEGLPLILNQEGLNYREINELRTLTDNMRFYPAFNHQKNAMLALIDRALRREREEFPIRELEILEARVRALYHQIKPEIEGHSKFKFYLIRDEAEWANDRVVHEHGEHEEPCLICIEELNHAHPGVACPFHPQVAYHASEDCLIPHIRNQIGEQNFPITCGDLEHPHELPLTEELLQTAGLEAQLIRTWKIQTLRSYYAELIRLQQGSSTPADSDPNPEADQVLCATPDCGAIIFPEAVRAGTRTHVCEVCAVERCHHCRELPHRGRDCGRAEGEIMPPYDSLFRPCPYCLTITERIEGCNSIRCQNRECGREWHFNFGRPRPGHRVPHDFEPDNRHPRPREYRVPGDPDYVEGQDMECAFP